MDIDSLLSEYATNAKWAGLFKGIEEASNKFLNITAMAQEQKLKREAMEFEKEYKTKTFEAETVPGSILKKLFTSVEPSLAGSFEDTGRYGEKYLTLYTTLLKEKESGFIDAEKMRLVQDSYQDFGRMAEFQIVPGKPDKVEITGIRPMTKDEMAEHKTRKAASVTGMWTEDDVLREWNKNISSIYDPYMGITKMGRFSPEMIKLHKDSKGREGSSGKSMWKTFYLSFYPQAARSSPRYLSDFIKYLKGTAGKDPYGSVENALKDIDTPIVEDIEKPSGEGIEKKAPPKAKEEKVIKSGGVTIKKKK